MGGVERRLKGDELRRRGHALELCNHWSLGRVCAAAKDGALLKAAANPRLMQKLRDRTLTRQPGPAARR